jgi:formate-dependent phosphoribosylglycinamide formyltransferase (GAR transformylase)
MDRDELQKIVEELDEIGTSPFRYFTAYESTQHLVAELPYRREVAGVLDTPDKLLMYGSWGMDFSLL